MQEDNYTICNFCNFSQIAPHRIFCTKCRAKRLDYLLDTRTRISKLSPDKQGDLLVRVDKNLAVASRNVKQEAPALV